MIITKNVIIPFPTVLLSECYGVKIVPPLQWDIQNITPLPHITISHFTFPRIFYNFQFSMIQKSVWHFSQEFHLNLIFSIVISAIYPPLLRFAEEESEAKLNKVIMVSWKSYSQSLPLLLSQTNSSIEAIPHTNRCPPYKHIFQMEIEKYFNRNTKIF